MKKLFFVLVLFLILENGKAQSYLGYFHDNYAGVNALVSNPAFIADSPFKTDINLFSASAFVSNDYYGVTLPDVFKSGYDIDTQAKKFQSSSNNAFANIDILGPSFMFNITPKHTIAVFSRGRGIVNITGIDGDFYNKIDKSFNINQNFTAKGGDFNIAAQTWAEVGLSYAAVILNKDKHFIKGGLSLKYLKGLGNTFIKSNNANISYNNVPANPGANTFTTNGTLIYGGSQDFEKDEIKYDTNSSGIGADLGFIYELRPDNNDNKYKLRLGLSVTDIGAINYKEGNQKTYNLNNTVTQAQYDNEESLLDFLNKYYAVTNSAQGIKASLPTAAHFNADWNVFKKFFLDLNVDYSLNNKKNLNKIAIANTAVLTPRYEVKWFSGYLPISYSDYRGAQVGAGFRLGPLFIGSSSVISNLVSKESKGFDFHLGLKIPVYRGKPRIKDTDNDGVLDKEDKCPEIAGPVDNNGCPYTDKDKDGVLDKDDKCPDVAGTVKNNGCPDTDKDGDGVLDKSDKCPDVAGPKENSGCPYKDKDKDGVLDKDDKCPEVAGPTDNNGCPYPDTDGDSVLDKDDKCPDVKGTVANNGCPEVDNKVLKSLNDFSKKILFDTGKATIKKISYTNLDAIVGVMKEFGDSKFKIEGYTDNAGKKETNLKLSKNRAAAVKDYLISKGIDSSRLSSEGYGSLKPITSNKTPKGRAQNRRVEISLIK